MRPSSRVSLALSSLLLWAAFSTPAGAGTWQVEAGKVSFSLPPGRLASLGLEVVGAARTVDADAPELTGLEPPVLAFSLDAGGTVVRTEESAFVGFESKGPVAFPVRGGFGLRAEDPATGAALPPALLYDFRVEIRPGTDEPVRILAAPGVSVPIDVRNVRLGMQLARHALTARVGDVTISKAWAAELGRPDLAGQWIGTVDLALSVAEDAVRSPAAPAPRAPAAAAVDGELGELFGMQTVGRDAAFPTGNIGVAPVTSACNPGTVDIQWELGIADTLKENHPFISMVFYREDAGGTLEMIGQAWIKHTFAVVATDLCGYGCNDAGFKALGVGCSDTYGVGFNSSRLYLGPREEVNPYAVTWTACGSFFDGTPQDCFRSYFGSETSQTAHRLELWDEDLGNAGARYFYEATYYFNGDTDTSNNIGWRECTTNYTTEWTFTDTTAPARPDVDGALVATWGDQQVQFSVAPDDGEAYLAVKTTDLGSGQWHYEYALLNFNSNRGIRSFAVPTGSATISNITFHDVDKDSTNEWTSTSTPGLVSWETDDWGTDPNAPALGYHTMFNFGFDADAAPVSSQVMGGLFLPGTGTSFFVSTLAPSSGATAVLAGGAAPSRFELRSVDPNPFRAGTRVAFSLDRELPIRLSVADVSGRLVRVLAEGTTPAGRSTVHWDGLDASGARVAGGVYFFRLESAGEVRTIKGVLLR